MAESRSEREAHIKDKAGWVITVVAALSAVNTYLANGTVAKKTPVKKPAVKKITKE
jgi:hypothetical protein